MLVGHGSGIPSTGLRKACLSVCCHENCLLWTIPSIPSISFFFPSFPFFWSESERFCVIFPLFVHNPSAFRREAPSEPSKAPHRVPRHPRPTPTCAAAYAPTRTPSPKGARARSPRGWGASAVLASLVPRLPACGQRLRGRPGGVHLGGGRFCSNNGPHGGV